MVNVTYGSLQETADGVSTNPLGTDFITTIDNEVAGQLTSRPRQNAS